MRASVQPQAESAAFLKDYLILLKPRVMSLVIFTGFATLAVVPVNIHPLMAFCALLFLSLGAGSAAAFNMAFEEFYDTRMHRTQNRPIPQGRITASEALTFAALLAGFAVFNMGVLINWWAAGLLAFSIFFYAVVYTLWLKPRTSQNIVIGGLAGALPPMIMDLAATGTLHPVSVCLTALIFFWTPAHFWALCLLTKEDYRRAGWPMLPLTHGDAHTRRQIFYYTLAVIAMSLVPVALGYLGVIYMAAALGMGIVYAVINLNLTLEGQARQARRSFLFSIVYLFSLFLAAMGDSLL